MRKGNSRPTARNATRKARTQARQQRPGKARHYDRTGYDGNEASEEIAA